MNSSNLIRLTAWWFWQCGHTITPAPSKSVRPSPGASSEVRPQLLQVASTACRRARAPSEVSSPLTKRSKIKAGISHG
ncbi:hypothetical protein G6F46_015301 [Rhizopus delemar]|nr:hypothetical protein G6F46_015301 [Rhizopus delemar]